MSFVNVSTASSCAESVLVDPDTGVAAVAFKEGMSYLYKNVSLQSIQTLLKQSHGSVDGWVNDNLRQPSVSCTLLCKGRSC
tara:strand:- start:170 stop:412 length:243 start_codon:yes stop_codon:yes gene_type:complete